MKVVAINGSARKGGNTTHLINHVLKELEAEGIETKLVELAGKKLRGCFACRKCIEKQNQKCAVNDDANDVMKLMFEADGVILASPVYFTDVTAEMKALIDRAGYVSRANGTLMRRKVGAAVVAVRRAGSLHTYDTLNHFFGINEMVVPGSSYWNMGIGLDKGDVENDEEGIDTMRTLGINMAWLMKKLYA
mgnify:FL=1